MNDVWVPEDDQRFFNLSRHLELVEAGLVPLDTLHNSCPVPGAALPGRRPTVAKKTGGSAAAKPSWKETPKTQKARKALAAHLLEHQTIPDSSWKDVREELDMGERRKGEKRAAFIKRVLLGEEPEPEAEPEPALAAA